MAARDSAVSAMFDELEAAGIETGGFGSFSKGASLFDHGAAAPIVLRWLPKIEDGSTSRRRARRLIAGLATDD